MRLLAQVAVAPLLLVWPTSGCSPNVGEVACRDVVSAIGDVAVRCGFDRRINEDVFEANATLGAGCEGVVGLRDEEEFYDGCIPFVEMMTCAQFDDPGLEFPASCEMQLLVNR